MGIKTDTPIQDSKDDVLSRAKLAESFSEQILSLDASDGIVVGVLGPWGSGKTSFINLTQPHLKKAGATILNFNPWMFSGTKQLIESFFRELSEQLRTGNCSCFDKLADSLRDYGEIFARVKYVSVFGLGMLLISKYLRRGKKGIDKRKAKVTTALASLDKPIVVIVDDIDRLTASEIRNIFQLIRLTGNFPNVIYITEFDRKIVEKVLEDEGVPGRDYLEKILQLAVDLPAISEEVLTGQIAQGIENALSEIENAGPFDKNRWYDVFPEIIRPMMRTLRHVRRYCTALPGTVKSLEGQVNLVDVLALEAVRMFLPDLFAELHKSIPALTTISDRSHSNYRDPSPLTNQINNLIGMAGKHEKVSRRLIRLLFPAARRQIGDGVNYSNSSKTTWLKDRRVAHEDILRLYLERFPSGRFQAFVDAEQAWGYMIDKKDFDNYLRSLPTERLQDVIERLEVYEEQFTREHVEPGTIVLLNLLTELPDRQVGFFDLDPRNVVRRIVYRVLRTINDRDEVAGIVKVILPQIRTLWAKWELILMVGHRKNTGHKLVSETAAQQFERSWRDMVRSASVGSLAEEKSLLWTFYFTKQNSGPDEPPLTVPDSPGVTRAMLRSARQVTRSQGFGSRAVVKSYSLAWDNLVDVYGGEDVLRDRIEKLKATNPTDLDDILEMVDKYLGGWRPADLRNFGAPEDAGDS